MKKIISILLVAAMSMALLVGCGNTDSDYKYITDNGKMVIGITIYEPMNYYDENNKLIGFDTEFAEEVCKELGVEPVFQIIDWKAKETELKAKNIDCIWNGLTVTEERKADMDFTTTYLKNRQCVVINKANESKFSTTEGLASAIISAEAGSAGETAVKADANLKNASYTGSDTQAAALLGLVAGNFDAIIIDYTMAKACVGEGDYADFMIVESIDLEDEFYAIGFRVGSDMTEKVNDIIDDMIEDGRLAAIAEKYDRTDLYNEAVNN